MNQKQIRAAVEAMLFAYAEPIGADKLAQALQLPTASVESALEALHERCQKEDSGLCLLHLNTHWQLATKTEFAECVRRVLDTRRSIPLALPFSRRCGRCCAASPAARPRPMVHWQSSWPQSAAFPECLRRLWAGLSDTM